MHDAEDSPLPDDGPAEDVPAEDVPAGPSTAGSPVAWLALALIVVLLIGAIVLTATGGSSPDASSVPLTDTSTTSAVCGPAAEQPLDPSSVVRLLPNAPAPTYATNPPTSGAFQVGAQAPPVSATELSPVVQVGLLAQGTVLIQYRDLEGPDVATLQTLAGDGVVVAPNSTLDSPVVATAWRKRQVCSAVDIDALRTFVVLSADRGPSAGPNGTSPPTTG